MSLYDRLNSELEERVKNNALRSLQIISDKVDFSSNDYLGFAQDADLHKVIIAEISKLRKFGSTGSRLLTGNHSLTEQLEKEVAIFHDADSALFFNSGYEANAGLISTITKRNDTLIFDELCHASLREGIRLSNANSWSFKHNDLVDLELKLQKAEGEKFIVVESVYSMDGDLSPLKEIVFFAERYNANIILDEAHATGVIGKQGEGLAQNLSLHKKIFARVHTCGKAIGNNGAFVLGNSTLKNYIINFCRPFIYTTGPNLIQVIAVRGAYRKLTNATELVAQLQDNCSYFKKQISRHKQIHLLPSDSAIFSVLIPGNAAVKLASIYLSNAGQDVRPILSPTVKEGAERLRICLHSYNTKLEIDRLIKLLDQFTTFTESESELSD